MFSGGKDSLALTYAVRDHDAPAIDCFLYNPAESQRSLAKSLVSGGRIIEVRRQVLPELLALNDAGRPNGHTPYSAYLAIAALLAGYLRGSPMVLAGNSRSDDEPNVSSYLGIPVNHQWTKSHEFEAALSDYRHRWLPGAPLYSSPLRPLLELQIIRSLQPHMDAYLKTASCNKAKGLGWCRKCAWVFLATSSLFGHDLAVSKAGGDLFADPGLSALAACLRDPAVQAARPLDMVLKDWGQVCAGRSAFGLPCRSNRHVPLRSTRGSRALSRPSARSPHSLRSSGESRWFR